MRRLDETLGFFKTGTQGENTGLQSASAEIECDALQVDIETGIRDDTVYRFLLEYSLSEQLGSKWPKIKK